MERLSVPTLQCTMAPMWFWLAACTTDPKARPPTETSSHSARPPHTGGASTAFTAETGSPHTGETTTTTDACDDPATWFVPETVFDAGGDALAVVAADLDQDGDEDLLVEEYYDEAIGWHENGAAWALHPQGSVWKGDAAALAAGDLTGDGLADVLTAQIDDTYYSSESPVGVRVNTAGTFGSVVRVDLRAGHASTSAAVADLTGDGAADLVVAQDDGTFLSVASGGGFGPLVSIGQALAGRLLIGDLDGDGRLDVAGVLGWLSGQDGTFSAFGGIGVATLDAELADLDGDGDLDLARFSAHAAWWDENLGGGAFAAPVALFDDAATTVRGGLPIDLDRDGAIDLLVFADGGKPVGAEPRRRGVRDAVDVDRPVV
jgi:hypothetical protein